MPEYISGLLKNKKIIIFSLAALGILLILISYIMPMDNNESTDDFSESEYIDQLENRVALLVSQIQGAGSTKVMINIDSTIESVYVKENKKSYNNDQTTSKGETEDSVLTMTDSSGNQSALITKQIMPNICGVTVVCDGADIPSVQKNVIEAVSTLLNIGTNKVCVIAKAK